MPRNKPLALLASGAVVVAVVGGVALITVGRPLFTGEAFNAARPSGAHQVKVTAVTLTTSAVSPVMQGTPVALTAAVTPAAVGTVQFKDGITSLGGPVRVSNGTASGSTSSLTAGSHSLIAEFTPGNPSIYGPSTSPAMMLVVAGALATTTVLATSPVSPVAQGAPVTLTGTITPATATGTVQFKDGATNLGNLVTVSNGIASGSISSLIAGPHQLTAAFTPADPMALSPSTSSPMAFVVTAAAGPVATSTSLTTSPASPAAQGSPVTLTATITPATVAGTVQFRDGSSNLGNPVAVSNGTASGSTSTLAVGSRSLTAVLTPSAPALFSSSTSPPESFVITASTRATATSTALVTSPASPVRRGTQVALIATITPSTTAGVVQFRDGVINLGNPVVVSNGAASATTSTLAVGGHQLTAVFSPSDPTFAPSTSPVLAFEVTDPGLADLSTCLRVLRNCPNPRAGTTWTSRFDHVDLGIEYLLADRPRNIGSWAGWSR
ncbi:MAG: Ig-like domain-containing protein [Pseudonocardiaceae bacterium]